MTIDTARPHTQAFLVTALVLLALVGAACGDDDGDGSGQASAKEKTTAGGGAAANDVKAEQLGYERALKLKFSDGPQPEPSPREPDKQMAEDLNDVQLSIAAASPEGVCMALSDKAERATAGPPPDTADSLFQACKDTVRPVVHARRKAEGKTEISRVTSVDLNGNRAVVHVENADGSTHDVPFFEEDGIAWKVDDLGSVDPELAKEVRAIIARQ